MGHKTLVWIGSSQKDLSKLPNDVIDFMIYGLRLAQRGERSTSTKSLKGFGGAGIIEIIDSDISGAYRTVYTISMKEVVFVLHLFQKKSKHGIKTLKRDMDLIKSRLKLAREIYKAKFKKK